MNKLIILSGIPGSGKSTFAANYVKENKDSVIIGRDKLRELLFGYTEANVQSYYSDERFKEREDIVTAFQQSAIQLGLSTGKTVLIDDTNCNYARLQSLFDHYKHFGVEVKFFDTPLCDCISRNALRTRQVSIEIISNYYERFLLAKGQWEARNSNKPTVLDEKGFVFVWRGNSKPYLIRMWNGEPWLFYWHADNRWVSARKVNQNEVWAVVENRISDEQAEHYHKLNARNL